jgi:hypothetical protein
VGGNPILAGDDRVVAIILAAFHGMRTAELAGALEMYTLSLVLSDHVTLAPADTIRGTTVTALSGTPIQSVSAAAEAARVAPAVVAPTTPTRLKSSPADPSQSSEPNPAPVKITSVPSPQVLSAQEISTLAAEIRRQGILMASREEQNRPAKRRGRRRKNREKAPSTSALPNPNQPDLPDPGKRPDGGEGGFAA